MAFLSLGSSRSNGRSVATSLFDGATPYSSMTTTPAPTTEPAPAPTTEVAEAPPTAVAVAEAAPVETAPAPVALERPLEPAVETKSISNAVLAAAPALAALERRSEPLNFFDPAPRAAAAATTEAPAPTVAETADAGAPTAEAPVAEETTVEKAPAAPVAEAEEPAPTNAPLLDPERRILAADREFQRDRLKGLVMLGAGLWLALLAGALVAVTLAPLDLRGLAVAAGVALATYAVAAIITGLLLDRSLERKFNAMRKIARIGCERVRVDDVDLVAPSLRDVLGEWLHIQFFIRRHRETNYWFMWGYGVQSALTLVGLALLPWSEMIADPMIRYGLLAGAAALTIGHAVYEIQRLARQRRALILEEAGDPTEVIAERMVGLLSEVKELRKHGRHDH